MKWSTTITHRVTLSGAKHEWGATVPIEYRGSLGIGIYYQRPAVDEAHCAKILVIGPSRVVVEEVSYDMVRREQQIFEYAKSQLRTARPAERVVELP